MRRPSGSFQEDFRRDPSCLINMCDALTWLEDIFQFPQPDSPKIEERKEAEVVRGAGVVVVVGVELQTKKDFGF